jgi:hypothetical protein
MESHFVSGGKCQDITAHHREKKGKPPAPILEHIPEEPLGCVEQVHKAAQLPGVVSLCCGEDFSGQNISPELKVGYRKQRIPIACKGYLQELLASYVFSRSADP